jgi:hypothetical protein
MKALTFIAILTSCFAVHQATPKQFGGLHPALQVDSVKAVAVFDKGYKDADKYKDLWKAETAFYRDSAKSYMIVDCLQYSAYKAGFNAKKQYLVDAELKAKRDEFASCPPMDTLSVRGILSGPPDSGTVSTQDGKDTYAMPGVRAVLKVGEKVFQPRAQPGELLAEYKSYDYTSVESGSRTVTTSIPNGDGSYHDQQTVVPTTNSVRHADAWLEAPYTVAFDLFNEDGTPRITPSDKEITLILILGTTQKQFKFKTGDFAKLLK